jgi:SAM-dependent methyltransferase
VYLSGDSHHSLNIHRPFTYFLCKECRLRFQVVAAEEAQSLFADVQDTAPRTSPTKRKELCAEEDVFRTFHSLGLGTRLLDVGAGDGRFLAAARQAGFDCMGTDVSSRLAESAGRKSGAEVLVGDLASLALPAASFDVINLDSVLMYVAAPRDLMCEVVRLLRPGGVCRVHEYDPDNLIGLIKGRHYWVYTPTHVNVWTSKSIAALGAQAGLQMTRAFAGTEASLKNWLATGRRESLWERARDTVLFVLRKVRLGNRGLAGDTVYYLRKPLIAGRGACAVA